MLCAAVPATAESRGSGEACRIAIVPRRTRSAVALATHARAVGPAACRASHRSRGAWSKDTSSNLHLDLCKLGYKRAAGDALIMGGGRMGRVERGCRWNGNGGELVSASLLLSFPWHRGKRNGI